MTTTVSTALATAEATYPRQTGPREPGVDYFDLTILNDIKLLNLINKALADLGLLARVYLDLDTPARYLLQVEVGALNNAEWMDGRVAPGLAAE